VKTILISLARQKQATSQALDYRLTPVIQLRLSLGGSQFQASLGKTFCENPISKITRAKRAGGVAQGVERLLSKYEALSSNPNTAKQTRKTGSSWI
jgi:hypothetical protein